MFVSRGRELRLTAPICCLQAQRAGPMAAWGNAPGIVQKKSANSPNGAKRFDKQKNSKIKTIQIAIQAWKADTSFAGAVRPREEAQC
jgi:hypothetical protein